MKSHKYYLLGIIFILLWLNTGVYAAVSAFIPSIMPYGVFGILLFFWLYTDVEYRIRWTKICLPIMVFYAITLINYYLIHNIELVPTHILYLLIALSVGLYCFELSESERAVVLYALLLDYLIVGINSWIMLSKYPELSRFLAAGTAKMEQYRNMGLVVADTGLTLTGSYGYFNSLVYLSMVFFSNEIKEKRITTKIVYGVATIFSVLLIVKGAFTTALIMAIIGLFLIALPRKTKNRAVVITVFLALFMVLSVSNVIPKFFQIISNMESLSNATRLRFSEIYMTLENNSRDASSIFARTVLYRDSLYSFFISPIGGHMLWGSYTIGQHSTFCDYLGMYGLIALLLVVGLRKYMKVEIQFVNAARRIVQSTWLIFLLTSFVNPVFIQNIFIALFVFVPCFLKQSTKNGYLSRPGGPLE